MVTVNSMGSENKHTVEKLKSSLLYELEEKDYDQIYIDYNNINKLEFEFVVDANDILEYIDPFSILYDNGQVRSKDYKADLNYAFKSLLGLKDKKLYLLPEYERELQVHKDLIAKIPMIHGKLLEESFKKEGVKNKDFVEQNASLILLIISGYSKTIDDVYKELFQEPRIERFSSDLYEKIFVDGDFSDEDKNRIKDIYELFPKKRYPDFVDAVGIFRIFMLNKDVEKGKRYIYLSSAKKSKQVLNEIHRRIENDDPKWLWLKKIVDSKHSNEKCLFLRNKQYVFGFFIYKYLLQLEIKNGIVNKKEHKKNIIKHLINISLLDVEELKENEVYEIIAQKREQLENFSVINNSNITDFMNEHSSSGNKYFDNLYESLKEYINNNPKTPKYDFLEERFTLGILNKLKEFCDENTLIFDRGKDKIISLFNSIPPLFLLNRVYDSRNLNKIFEGKIRGLMLEINEKHIYDVTKQSIDIASVLKILEESDPDKNFSNNLVFIFIIIIIEYSFKSKGETDMMSDELAFNLCVDFEPVLKERINKNKTDQELNKNKTSLVEKGEFFENTLRELYVLKLWADRRKGADYSKDDLEKKEKQHKILENKYPDDYRFYFSHFLTYLNLFYGFKESIRENKKEKQLKDLEAYVEKMILCGEKTLKTLLNVSGYEEDSILKETHRTLLNNIAFTYCIRLDIQLQKTGIKRANTKEMDSFVKSKDKIREKLNARKQVNPQADWNELRSKHPVYYYTESYGEYLEAIVDDSQEKLENASKAINKALEGIIKVKRSFFYKCCTLLNTLIEKNKTWKSIEYESFIMQLETSKL